MRISDPTQSDLILAALQEADGEWVDMPALAAASGSMNIHTRIDELRHRRGLHIENRCIRQPGSRANKSQYRLITSAN